MTKKTETVTTLSDEDMTTSRHLTRRSLLGSTRVAAGFGLAALLFGTLGSRSAHASSDRENTYDNDSGDRRPTTDND
jgi:hypothetical protein